MRLETLCIGAAVLAFSAGCNRSDGDGSVLSDTQANVTLTGCLQAGEQGLAPQEPNAAARSAEGVDEFVLANARMPGSPTDASPSPSPTSGTLYILDGKEDELRQFVGQQVEVTGTHDTSAADERTANAQHFDVDSVRMIASTCATN